MARRVLFISSLAFCLVASGQAPQDPVMKVRAQRAAAQGVDDGDLPALPRGIVEPPPLPPPEAHVRDTRKGRKASRRKRGKARAREAGHSRKAKAARARHQP